MTKPIADKAEIALEYPDKLYVGTFERTSRFEAHLDPTGIALIFERPVRKMFANRSTCTSILVCSLTSCASWLRRLGASQRTISCTTTSSRRRSPSCTGRSEIARREIYGKNRRNAFSTTENVVAGLAGHRAIAPEIRRAGKALATGRSSINSWAARRSMAT